MNRLSELYGKLLNALGLVACALLFAMMLMICADVLLRNVSIPGLPRGLAWSNEVSEMMLYLITMLSAPWLLRQGQHIRVDILLRAIPRYIAWCCEWIADICGLACCLLMVWYGARAALKSFADGSMTIKTLVTPEWWSLAPLPIAFALLGIEMLFRMHRLATGPREPRNDAVSAS
ncbi:MAG TPA: TRAP transporter small permease [Burkholderiales bacterium]|jgi:TRAP-type C4-dicarboxylate transport system permease small subunit|nr:TRAP transporter small permease [Burkholderiales bacterium]